MAAQAWWECELLITASLDNNLYTPLNGIRDQLGKLEGSNGFKCE